MGQRPFGRLVPSFGNEDDTARPRRANFMSMSCVMLLGGRLRPPKVDRADPDRDGHCAPSIYTRGEPLVCLSVPSLSITSSRLGRDEREIERERPLATPHRCLFGIAF